jgi:transaldolase
MLHPLPRFGASTIPRPNQSALLKAGAQVQRPLWASTSPKNTSYDALLYVNSIVADETVNTMPDATLVATLERGSFATSPLRDPVIRAESAALLSALPSSFSLSEVTTTLEEEGVDSFIAAYRELLATIETKLGTKKQGGGFKEASATLSK